MTAYRGQVPGDRYEAVRAARERAAELEARLTRLGTGERPTPDDVAVETERLSKARQRLKEALLRSAQAHRAAAATASRYGKKPDADRHLRLAEADDQAAELVERGGG